MTFRTAEVEEIVIRLRRKWWSIRMLALIGLLIGAAMTLLHPPMGYIGPIMLCLGGIHILAEINAIRGIQPTLPVSMIVTELFVHQRYLEEFSPEWVKAIADIERDLIEDRANSTKELMRLLHHRRLAAQQQLADAKQEQRNKERLVAKADAMGLGIQYRNLVVQMLNENDLDKARALIDQGRNIRTLLDRLEATNSEDFIKKGYQLLSEEGIESLEAALEAWRRRADLQDKAAAMHAEIEDHEWHAQVIAACESSNFATAAQLLSEAEAWVRRLRELRVLEMRITQMPTQLADRRAALSRQVRELKSVARHMKARDYRKATYELESSLAEVDAA